MPAKKAVRAKRETKDEKADTAKNKRSAFCDPIVWATFAIAITGFFMAAIAYFQWLTLQETNRIAAIAQRPYIASTDIRLNTSLPGIIGLDVLVTNSGGTPARDLQYLALTTHGQPDDPEIAFSNPPSPSQVDRVLIAPGGTTRLRLSGGYVTPLFHKMAEERARVFLYGIIYYRDQSPTSPQYVTKYCFDVYPNVDEGVPSVRYNQCIHWNCMDGDCATDRCVYEVRKTKDDYNAAQKKCADLSAASRAD